MTRESHAPPLAAGRESKCRFSRVAAARQRFFQTARAILARFCQTNGKKLERAGLPTLPKLRLLQDAGKVFRVRRQLGGERGGLAEPEEQLVLRAGREEGLSLGG